MDEEKKTITPKATADGVPVYCSHDAVVDTIKMVPNPANPNKHPDDQIKLLAKIIKASGTPSNSSSIRLASSPPP